MCKSYFQTNQESYQIIHKYYKPNLCMNADHDLDNFRHFRISFSSSVQKILLNVNI